MEPARKTIPGFRCYEISEDGRVFRKPSDRWDKTKLPESELRQQVITARGKKGKKYAFVTLVVRDAMLDNPKDGEDPIYDSQKPVQICVTRLMAMTFIYPQPKPRTRAVNIDGNTLNNSVGNVKWLTGHV